MENSNIEWCHHTFNHVRGCTKVAPGCANCYADTLSKRNPGTLGIWGPNGTRVVASESMWSQPVKWNLRAEANQQFHSAYRTTDPIRQRVFCASLADVFEDWQGPHLSNSDGTALYACNDCNKWFLRTCCCFKSTHRLVTLNDVRRRLFALIDATPNLDWLLLTKRPENIRRMLVPHCQEKVAGHVSQNDGDGFVIRQRHNLWLGTSIATQADAERNLDELGKCEDLSPVRFVSAEPLLEHIDLSRWLAIEVGRDGQWRKRSKFGEKPMIDWVIAGGESGGANARPMHPDWVRSLRDQCAAAGVPFLFKQWGDWLPMSHGGNNGPYHEFSDGVSTVNVGKKYAGRMLDGNLHDGYPKVTI